TGGYEPVRGRCVAIIQDGFGTCPVVEGSVRCRHSFVHGIQSSSSLKKHPRIECPLDVPGRACRDVAVTDGKAAPRSMAWLAWGVGVAQPAESLGLMPALAAARFWWLARPSGQDTGGEARGCEATPDFSPDVS